MFELKPYIETWASRVNKALTSVLGTEHDTGSRIEEAMAYSLMAGGKRVRPILCIASAQAVDHTDRLCAHDNPESPILLAACALEALHTYSLIHDDLPAMDDDDMRRGRPTCHIAYDEATAILAGDGLLTLTFELLSSVNADHLTDPGAILGIIRRVSQAAGCHGMIGGQMQDVLSEDKQLPLSELEHNHRLKTGAIIEAAVYTGATLGGADPGQERQLNRYARSVGLAFQVTDDILNVEGDAEKMGKAVGTDADRRKNTYPALLGMVASKAHAAALVNNALQALEGFDSRSDPLRAIASYIIERNR